MKGYAIYDQTTVTGFEPMDVDSVEAQRQQPENSREEFQFFADAVNAFEVRSISIVDGQCAVFEDLEAINAGMHFRFFKAEASKLIPFFSTDMGYSPAWARVLTPHACRRYLEEYYKTWVVAKAGRTLDAPDDE